MYNIENEVCEMKEMQLNMCNEGRSHMSAAIRSVPKM